MKIKVSQADSNWFALQEAHTCERRLRTSTHPQYE